MQSVSFFTFMLPKGLFIITSYVLDDVISKVPLQYKGPKKFWEASKLTHPQRTHSDLRGLWT